MQIQIGFAKARVLRMELTERTQRMMLTDRTRNMASKTNKALICWKTWSIWILRHLMRKKENNWDSYLCNINFIYSSMKKVKKQNYWRRKSSKARWKRSHRKDPSVARTSKHSSKNQIVRSRLNPVIKSLLILIIISMLTPQERPWHTPRIISQLQKDQICISLKKSSSKMKRIWAKTDWGKKMEAETRL